jgi:hypothetical protein
LNKSTLALAMVAVASVSHATLLINEGFNSVAGLTGAGYTLKNQSTNANANLPFQGNTAVFSAQAGAANSYVGMNYQFVNSGTGTLNGWIILPTLALKDGDTVSFWTRTVDNPGFPDRLQVRRAAGATTDTGVGATGIGQFTNLLLDINPTYSVSGYPATWTQYNLTLSGIGGAASNQTLAFRYFVEGGGPTGNNSDYIGIDSLTVDSAVPEPASMIALGLGAVAMIRRRKSA